MSERAPLNILHIFTDQHRFDAIGAHGHPCIRTPHIDRLIREGVSFQRAYSPSPECVPARSSMITGYYPGRAGCYGNGYDMPPEDTPTFMSRLRDAGYHTHGVGKCHFTPDTHALRGFVSRETQEELPKDRTRDDYNRNLIERDYGWILEPHGVRGEMYYIPQPSLLPERDHPSRWIGDRSVDFIQTHVDSARPWYLYSSFIHPHPPFAPPVPWHKLYRGPQMPLPDIPDNSDELITFINRLQNRFKYRDRGGHDLNLIRQLRAYYYACISFIDAQVGRMLEALEKSGQLDRTLIVFSADHGDYLGDFGSFGKRGMHDVSARVPMICRWPDQALAGTRPDTPVSLVDLAPTFLETAGIAFKSADFDGVPLRSVAEGKTKRERVFSQYEQGPNGLYMTVEKRWKYIYSATDQKEFLFDLESDAKEHHNLAPCAEHAATLDRMRRHCIDLVRSQGQQNALTDDGRWKTHPVRRLPADLDYALNFQDPRWWDGKLPEW